MPYRTGLYTNKSNWNERLFNTTTFPRLFKEKGYSTYSAGKVFHRSMPEDFNKKTWTKVHQAPVGRNPNANKPVSGYKVGVKHFDWGPLKETDDDDYSDSHHANWCADLLKQKHNDPFMVVCGLYKPHVPMYAPQKYFDLYKDLDIKLPLVKGDDIEDIPETGKAMIESRNEYKNILKENLWQEAVKSYMATISFADVQVGKLLKALNEGPNKNNTIVILFGDNGMHQGEKMRFTKATLWEPAAGVPLIVKTPGGKTGKCHRVVSLIDLFPTLVDLAKISGDTLDGQSLVPLLKEPEKAWNSCAVTTLGIGNLSFRNENWHFIQYVNGEEELYKHSSDPEEWFNIANKNEYEKIKTELLKYSPVVWEPPLEH